MTNSNWTIRNANGEDLAFIYATWLNSYRYDAKLSKGVRNQIYFAEYNRVIDRILTRDNTKVQVACKPDEPIVIFGFMVSQPGVYHYCFVKEAFWKQGIAHSLAEASGNLAYPNPQYTHRTSLLGPVLAAHPELIYNPFILFKQTQKEHSNVRIDRIDNPILKTNESP
jgi:hypothetical protein